MIRKTALIAVLIPFLLPYVANADDACGNAEAKGTAYSYCIREHAESKNQDVIYYLHGGGGNEQEWATWGGPAFESFWLTNDGNIPTVITVSFGTDWLLGDVSTNEHVALLPLFTDSMMPELEKRLKHPVGKRMLMGPSMGGYNSAELALRAPNKFSKAILLCPGMPSVDPWASDIAVNEYLKSASPKIVRENFVGSMLWIRADFLKPEVWARHDPVKLAESAISPGTEFMVNSSFDDSFGFYSGAKKFAEALQGNGFKTTWNPSEIGGHCGDLKENMRLVVDFIRK